MSQSHKGLFVHQSSKHQIYVHVSLKDVVDATHKVVYEAFNELSEKDRTAFLSEYRQRVEASHVPVR